ncbi:FAD-dependent oxidoreductase [Phragmitibacter flavus]|uniref:FAD-dependent oxidoreductase n=1 Tax=Phragmitibacter flavus TaxID=2576071 RepID=A0A5R8KGR3_9BACT|nr:FAD-dependent oxidoreductase [Phragmitibacter flavus]TLD71504.1 FAD-dependent oxidoreductase [Phragmitibacter flavus]
MKFAPPRPRRLIGSLLGLSLLTSSLQLNAAEDHNYDLVIYGGTCAGVIAAVQAKKMGKTAIIVGPDKHLGGLSSGGLGFTDTGNKAVIGGLSRDFYHRIYMHYQKPEAWKWQKREDYGNKGQGTPAMDGENRTMWIFEPHVAELVFEDYIKEFDIPVHRDEWLDREKGVKKEAGRITQITMLSGKTYTGKMFIDATYEGDLMAAAKVDYHVGREANSVYGEEHNGVQVGVLHHRHHFGVLKDKVDPYVVPGDPSSGVLPRINPNDPGKKGEGDKGVQAYCFRMCLTNHPENRVPFPKPDGYDPKQYELLIRIYNAGWTETFDKFDPIPNLKTDTNNHGPFSFDNIGYNHDYPDASYERRKEIIQEHITYQQGLLYFISTDPRIPADVQKEMKTWGLPKDEYADNGNWSPQLYIREARRLVGDFVMTENELRKLKPTPDSVGMGSYTIDSHNIQRYITPEGYVQNEGDIGVSTNGPYEIAYGSLVPKKGQADNLFVPVCVSSSHIAFGSIRMEPVFMILAQSAATAAVMAIDGNLPVQDVPYEQLREQLLKDGQILEAPHLLKTGKNTNLPGIVVDDTKAQLTGSWETSGAGKNYVGTGYRHDNNVRGTELSKARFDAALPKSGKYEVRLAIPHNPNRASNAKVVIRHQGGEETIRVNQRELPPIDDLFLSLGTYQFDKSIAGVVTISNEDADGYVIADAVQFLPK